MIQYEVNQTTQRFLGIGTRIAAALSSGVEPGKEIHLFGV
jgi:hypothetical protein